MLNVDVPAPFVTVYDNHGFIHKRKAMPVCWGSKGAGWWNLEIHIATNSVLPSGT